MSMLVAIKGFKCFREVSLEFENLTILTGYNGAGKSTVIQMLLLLSQSLRLAPSGEKIALNGPLTYLGNAIDIVYNGQDTSIEFSLTQGGLSAQWQMVAEKRARHLTIIHTRFDSEADVGLSDGLTAVSPSKDHPTHALCASIRDLSFLGASRLFSTDAWPTPAFEVPIADVGKAGEFAPYWHFHLGDDEVPPERRHPDDERSSIRGQIDAYLGDLFPGAQANTDQLIGVDLYRLELRLDKGEWVRPGNIGFGLTYAFPLLVALVAAKKEQIVIVDSPEAHLHPRAQSALGKIVARFAAAGVRVIVETHSDHFLNGVRLAVLESTISPSDTSILFFGGATESEHGIQRLNLDANGEIDRWPSGFFDQTEMDLSRLLGIEVT